MLCEHDLMHGKKKNLPVVANPHLTNPSLRDLNQRQTRAVTGTLLGKVMRNSGGEQRTGNAYSSPNDNSCQGPLENKKFTTKSLVEFLSEFDIYDVPGCSQV